MSASRKLRIDASDRACHECRKRKTRCIIPAGNVACSYCSRRGKECIFNERPERTPLTRKNLDAAESRCRELELILRQRQNHPSPGWDFNGTEVLPSPSKDIPNQSMDQQKDDGVVDTDVRTDRGDQWQEESTLEDSTEQDGMASLALPSKESGYLGSSSGSSILQSLSAYLSPTKSTPSPRTHDRSGESPNLAQKSIQFLNIISSSKVGISAARDHFVNAYFVAYNSSYPILHERTFRDECLRKKSIPPNDIWHVIYYAVLAIGEWVSGHCTGDDSLYYEAARSRLSFDVLESGSMGLVQALTLLGNYLQKRDRPNTGYNFIGIAYRVALGLGLHRELPSGNGMNQHTLQRRRLLFWTLYCFDSGLSMTTGRPTLVSDTFIDIRKPINVDETFPVTSAPTLHEVNYPTTCSAIIAQARLAVIANKVYSNFLSVRACSDVEDLVATMEQTIRNWRSSLPSFFFDPNVPQWFLGPRQILLWKEANLQIALLLASQRNHVDDQDKMLISTKCQTIALTTIHDISNFCLEHMELVHVGLCWYAVYFLLHALLALGLHQLKARQNRSWPQLHGQEFLPESVESATSKARECLEKLGRTNRAALRTLQILDRIEDTLGRPTENENTHIEGNHSADTSQQYSNSAAAGAHQTSTSTSYVGGNSNGNNTVGNDQNMTTQSVFPETSPEGTYADCVMNEWVATADPSLHFFFDNGTAELDNMFQGMQGFPNVLDGDSFGYMTSTMHSIRVPEQQQHDWERFGG